MKKQLFAFALAIVMIVSMPLAVSAEWTLDCSGWWTAHSSGVQITETAQTWTFSSKSYDTATENYHCPSVVVYGGNGTVGGAGYVEEMVIRSDAFAWTIDGDSATLFSAVYPADWAAWREANKAGVTCTITAQLMNGFAVVGIRNSDCTCVWITPVEDPTAPVYLSVTGEQCTLTNWQSGGTAVDISAAVSSVTPTDTWSVVCGGLGSARSESLSIGNEPKSWTFTSTTNSDAVNNWDSAAVEPYAGSAWGATIRSDSYAWNGAGVLDSFNTKNYPADWAAWLAANKAGASCTVTAQTVAGSDGDYIVVGFSNNGVTNVYIVPVTGSLDTAAIYLTGENCVLTDLASTTNHIDLSAAVPSIPTGSDPSESTGETTDTTGATTDTTGATTDTTGATTDTTGATTDTTGATTDTTGATTDTTGATTDTTGPSTDATQGSTEWKVVCTGLGVAKSEALKLSTTAQTWRFISTTNANAVNNWDTASVEVYTGTAGSWALTARSDSFAVSVANGWGTDGESAFGAKAYPPDWAAWLAENKDGAECIVTAQLVEGADGNYAVVGFSNAGVVNIYTVPVSGLDNTNLYLTGENCVLTKLSSGGEGIDISAAVASVPAKEEEDPEATTESTEDEAPAEWVVDCPTWWGGHTPAVKITETKQSWTFTGTSYATAADNWDTPTVVVWRSADGTMTGTGYLEELLIRSDSFAVSEENYWGTAGQDSVNSKVYPADWAAWLDANKAGVQCTVTAQIVNDQIVVAFSNNGVTNVYCVPMSSSSNGVYLSVTGEECTLSNWKATSDHLDIRAGVTYANSVSNKPSDPDNADTGDDSMILLSTLTMISSLCALVYITGKRRFAK